MTRGQTRAFSSASVSSADDVDGATVHRDDGLGLGDEVADQAGWCACPQFDATTT